MSDDVGHRRRRFATAAGVVVGGAAYLLTLLDFGTSTTRTANGLGFASNFFDLQARAFMAGHLYVPDGSLSIEGFIQRGHEYEYFGPFPALLRLPVLMTTQRFDGRLTVVSMALAFVLLAVVTSRLLWLVRDLMYPGTEVTRLEATALGVFLALALGGTTLTYNASLPWVYHEVYAWAVPFVVGAMYWMLRVLRRPDAASIGWLLVFALGAVTTRTTGGWAVSLGALGIGVWMLTGRLVHVRRRTGLWLLGVGVVALGVGVAINYAKFRHPYLFPLEDQVFSSINAHRREALAVNGGTITGPQFFPTAFMAYFRPDGIRFVDYFPYLTLPAHPAQAYDGAFLDQSYRTGSVTSFMPWLLALTVLAVVVLFRPGVDLHRRMLRVPLVAGVLVTGGVMAYGYFAFRYTCEFVPALVIGGAVGTCALVHAVQHRPRWLSVPVVALTVPLTAFSIGASMITGYSAAATTYGGPRLIDYLYLQQRLSGPEQAGLVRTSTDLPASAPADVLLVRGDCDELFLSTGEDAQPWLLVERRSAVVVARLGRDTQPARVPLVRVDTEVPSNVWLETDGEGRARLLLITNLGTQPGQWFDVLSPGVVRIGVLDRPELGYAEISSTPGGPVGFLRTSEYGDDGVSRVIDIQLADDPARAAAKGIRLSVQPGLTPPLCASLEAEG
ncbi:hypothetical protein H5V45_03005 [Nocardioides sp. KIGAM211]|uniref:Glycosyltransferase RgtA/B/C/D-like domain-containing protein n=1 Tax=Nocardioides luti TaxID=2761101 RepID=A0A7X0RDF6_9ACTN|nr:hypothetical protein [Nocardioides luti]MBB6626283.1 hypothetical protein [Nocardioides luti]